MLATPRTLPGPIAEPFVVDSLGRPRFWGSVWTLLLPADLAESTLKTKLRYLESFYTHVDATFGFGRLDDALADCDADLLGDALEAYFISIRSLPVMSATAEDRWSLRRSPIPYLEAWLAYPIPAGNQGLAVVDLRDLAEAAAKTLTEEGHNGKTYDLVSSEMLRGPDAATMWSRLLGKRIAYVGRTDFDSFEAQLREKGSPSWLAYDLRVMFQGFVERGFSNTEDQAARFAASLGPQPRTYSRFAEELAMEWAAA